MSELAKEIISVDIEKELKTSYLDYAMSVIIGRALPDVRDGLKPVHRRALYAMHVLNNDWNKPYKKSARVVGDIIGKYHPHGDAPAYEAIVRMAQSFSLRYPLIDGQGNFGSIDGDSPAAMRYTEIRLARITHELLEELDQETVDFVPNYDGAELIPEVLPARLPNLLINGSSGIAVGMATNIPPHNLVEVIDGCLAYLADPNISIEALMAHIPGPDFPTAAIINGRQGIEEAYRTGRGRVVMRSRAEIERDKQQRETIIIHELPYQVNKARLIEKIAELVKEKKIEGISALRDESDREGMRVVIEIKRDAMADIVLNNLYTQTPLQTSFGVNMVALHQGQPKLMALKDILQAFISHRREVVSRRTLYQLRKTRERAHILEGLAVALTNIDSMIQLIRQAQNATEAKRQLLARDWVLGNLASQWDAVDSSVVRADWAEVQYGIHAQSYRLSPQQAQAILEMRLHKLTGLEHEKLLTEYRELLAQVSALLANLQNIDGLVQEELIAMKTLYPDARRTEIISSRSELQISDLIAPEEVIVTLSHYGYVKYQLLSDYEAQRRGGKGRSATPTKADDFIEQLLVTNTHDTLLCFSSRGRLYWLKVYELPQASRGARGKPIVNLLPLESAERITAILPVRDYPADRFVLMATALGTVKKIALSAFSRPRSSGLIALNLKEGDELIGVNITEGQDAIMLFSAHGKVVYFPEDQVRDMGRSATGVRGMRIAEQDRVVSLIVPRHQGQILTVTANGFGKRTPLADYPMKSRATQGVISIKVTQRNGCVVGAVQVEESDQMMLITDTGTLVRLRISEVNCIGRNTHGVRLIRTATAERVAALQRIAEIEVDEESA
ncbi:MAG: DNA topoisomerase (ATP-hydrolyzing) subunit A [Candidatus Symbiodolus clandestinus]